MSMDRLSYQAHLQEFRRRLIFCFATIGVAFVICYICSDPLVSFLFYPVRHALPPDSTLVFTALTEGFMTYLKVAFWSALIFSTPVILYQAWSFVAPGLYENEKTVARFLVGCGVGLFFGGGLFGYWVIMPAVLSITLGFADQGLEAMPRLQNYLLFALKTIFTFGLIFEIPFLMALFTRTGILAPDYFRRNRKYSYLALYVLAVLMVPTDLFSQVLLVLPLIAMFEAGIMISGWLGGRQKQDG